MNRKIVAYFNIICSSQRKRYSWNAEFYVMRNLMVCYLGHFLLLIQIDDYKTELDT
jgi:hypothetical protein